MAPQDGGQGRESLRTAMHVAVDREQFDYEALVAGVHVRAGRIRRRRAITAGVAAAVLGPALVGGAALVLPDILPGGDSTIIAPATRPDDGSTTAPVEESEATAEPTPAQPGPPWQDGAPPLPEGGFEVNEDLPNAWEIPDARPTGVPALDDLGVPQLAQAYPRAVPVMSLMVCDPGREGGAEPEAAQSFGYFSDEAGDPTIDLQVTGWADSDAARDGLVSDSYTLCTWSPDPGEPQPWPGHEGDEDYLLFTPEGSDTAAAVVRQGDYLVAVTVQDTGAHGAELATEIASRTADNLEALDPVHGRD
ncbi:hypothetical protein MWU75_01185 [Ornithinimicrobium sp. F0845]|uniref:hypothetical protein n=1 Tax=Ornithinimicrobium sp. F0845 TaxID=2926412 RepID=UPI001FF69470|nr:hypothetical protein [Ornithinimicrobium sp. F0845]MCK0110756.1 hypothetical protein [Ornithinimicrobium sp. F0845]